ncbi:MULTISPECIES: hypothetical protein [Calothrix]|uniref:Uncharacterized protein n=2 Tax=Calothrix TaxID=1186 RepID=A0ABR8AA03_9CYAN|nr:MULTISPECIES: hypothetical protein [Calothrix]MBD2195881.1 hypothetical protein [Calothrix parietina FACHB-288]MBD2227595.1 hypothetical protein [Calothrix anomala FACHB-343]
MWGDFGTLTQKLRSRIFGVVCSYSFSPTAIAGNKKQYFLTNRFYNRYLARFLGKQ